MFEGSGWQQYTSDALSGTGYQATKSTVTSPARSGDGAAKVYMPDPSSTSHYMWRANNVTWKMGDDAWIGISMRLGDDWKLTESQLRNDGSTFASLFGFRGDVANGPGAGIYATWRNGQPMFSSRTISGSVGATSGEVFFGPYTKNVWYDFVIHVKWSSDPNVGIREYWLNGKKVAEWRGATMYTPMTVRNRIGIYQGGGVDHARSLYYDNHRIGKSYAEVDPAR
ncbi:MAG: polysaccharide lyase [Actinomycetota bacterium]|nr:polysaccharide lyase [Actinomycetota bacterium]